MLALSLAQVQVPGGGKEAEGLVSASRSPGLTKEGEQREALAQSPSGEWSVGPPQTPRKKDGRREGPWGNGGRVLLYPQVSMNGAEGLRTNVY